MESEPGGGNLSHTSVVRKRFLPDLPVDSNAGRKSGWGRDPGLKRLTINDAPHHVRGCRGMSRNVNTTNRRTREKSVARPDRSFLIRRSVARPRGSTRPPGRHTVTVPSLEALRVERQRGRFLDRWLASFKKLDVPRIFADCHQPWTGFTESEGLKELWKKAIGLVVSVTRVGNQMAQWSQALERKTFRTFTDFGDDEYEELHCILFPNERIERKLLQEGMLSKTAQMIMSLPPQIRTKDDCEMVLYNLQSIAKFRRLPLQIQKDLVSHGHLMQVKSKRIIFRQGHVAVNWYFIVCGQGFARTIGVDTKKKRTLAILSQGMSFGETAINRKILRPCTVVSRTPMQLIYLPKWVYLKVFRSLKMVPEHITFLRNLSFMRNWPIEHLLKHPTQCNQGYYRKREVVVKNSKKSEFLYIVRSGQCAVYMRVPRAHSSWRDLQKNLIHPMIDIEGWPEARTDTGSGCQSQRSYVRFKRAASFTMESTHLASMSCLKLYEPDYYRQLHRAKHLSVPCEGVQKYDWPFHLFPRSKAGKMADRAESSGNGEDEEKEQPKKEEMKGKEEEKHVCLHQAVEESDLPAQQTKVTSGSLKTILKQEVREADGATNSPSPSVDRNGKVPLQVTRDLPPPAPSKTTNTPTRRWGKDPYSVSSDTVYLQIDTLSAGDVFGLSDLDLPDMKVFLQREKLCLVSLGAEVISLSKKFYMSYCNNTCQKEVFKRRRFYPSVKDMHIRYRRHLAWDQYTRKVVDEFNDDCLKKGRQFFGFYISSKEMIPNTTLLNSDIKQQRLRAASELTSLRVLSIGSENFL